MKTFKYWAVAVVSDLLLAALFYAWLAEGIEQAGNVAVFWMWVLSIISLLAGFTADKTTFEKEPRPDGFSWYHAATEICFISAFVWCGFVWLPAVRVVSLIAMEGARNREPKNGRKADCAHGTGECVQDEGQCSGGCLSVSAGGVK